jgi:hypothetical protein
LGAAIRLGTSPISDRPFPEEVEINPIATSCETMLPRRWLSSQLRGGISQGAIVVPIGRRLQTPWFHSFYWRCTTAAIQRTVPNRVARQLSPPVARVTRQDLPEMCTWDFLKEERCRLQATKYDNRKKRTPAVPKNVLRNGRLPLQKLRMKSSGLLSCSTEERRDIEIIRSR